MPEATVTVGDTEVEIRETDDGFEAVEAEDDVVGALVRGRERGSEWYNESATQVAHALDDAFEDPSERVDYLGHDHADHASDMGVCINLESGEDTLDFITSFQPDIARNGLGVYHVSDNGRHPQVWVVPAEHLK